MSQFGQVLTAMVTPYDDCLAISEERLEKLVNHLIDTGTDTLVVAGTTGESPTLTKSEKIKLFQMTKEIAKGRAKVMANVGSNSTADTIEFVKEIQKVDVDGIMLVSPYYNKPSQEGLYAHFSSIAAHTDLPVMLYNIPGRTGVNIKADTAIRLASIPNIVAIKESSGDLAQMTKIIEQTEEEFVLYSGDDPLTLPVLAIGGKGVVSVASHLAGREIKSMIQSYEAGNVTYAAAAHQALMPFFEGIFTAVNPVPIKFLLNERGIETGGVRLPLTDLTIQEKEVLKPFISFFANQIK